jgi:hypothetical protein
MFPSPAPPITPPFIGSYPAITPAGHMGDYFVNTRYLQPNRRKELEGVSTMRSGNFNGVFNCKK